MAIESEKFKKIEEDFANFKGEIKSTQQFDNKLVYYCELALENIKEGHQEVAIVLLCTIVETLAIKKSEQKHIEFYDWIVQNENIHTFSKEFNDGGDKKGVLLKWKEQYLEKFGTTRAFVNLILECYKQLGGIPSYIVTFKTETVNGVKTSTPRKPDEINEEALLNDFTKDIKMIYGEYRSKFIHEGEFIPFDSKINTNIGGISTPQSISSQDFARMVLTVMKFYLKPGINKIEQFNQSE